MPGVDREQVEDIVGKHISELENRLGTVIRAEFAAFSSDEREYHRERTENVIKKITNCEAGDYDELRDDLGFLRTCRRGSKKIALLVSASFLGLWAKSFWQDITALWTGT